MNASAEHEITPAAMEVEVATGAARCLLTGGLPQPVFWGGQWWAIRDGETNYRPVTDPDLAAQLDDDHARMTRARAATAEARDEHAQRDAEEERPG